LCRMFRADRIVLEEKRLWRGMQGKYCMWILMARVFLPISRARSFIERVWEGAVLQERESVASKGIKVLFVQ